MEACIHVGRYKPSDGNLYEGNYNNASVGIISVPTSHPAEKQDIISPNSRRYKLEYTSPPNANTRQKGTFKVIHFLS